jgi:two-component system phosphate regulon response regulator PhoB/two-component system alkaline phosphatase synthesis response regulator PhoP
MSETVKILPNTKVFIAEDDVFIGSLLVKRFQSVGAIVSTSNTGDTAMAVIKKEMPSVVLLDILLPGADGFQVLQQLKADPSTKNIPVIMLSNMGDKNNIDKAKKYGATTFLIKATMSIDEIVSEVAKLLKIETTTRG